MQGSAGAAQSTVAKAVADPATVTASRVLAEKVLSVAAAQSLASLLSGRRLLGEQVRPQQQPTHALAPLQGDCVHPFGHACLFVWQALDACASHKCQKAADLGWQGSRRAATACF